MASIPLRPISIAGTSTCMGVFKSYGFNITSEIQAGIYHVVFPITRTEAIAEKEGGERTDFNSSLASLAP